MENKIIPTDDATGILPVENGNKKPVTIIGNEKIRKTFDDGCLQQAVNAASVPGCENVVINPDAHIGYGAPVGCVMTSPSHIYPGPVGVDIKCSMSLIQFDIEAQAIEDKRVRRNIINEITDRTPTGAGKGQRSVKKAKKVSKELGLQVLTEGASKGVCRQLGIPFEWAKRCEDAFHVGHDGKSASLENRLDYHLANGTWRNIEDKIQQLGSYGGGNHFGEAEVVEIDKSNDVKDVAETFGLKDGHVAFLSHCGSRGLGHNLASSQFKVLQDKFAKWNIPLPANDKQLVYAPLGSQEANNYLDDMALGANFATVNHLLINTLIWDAFKEVIPNAKANLVYFISHNIARQEVIDKKIHWVHRKGATRAFPAGHHGLKGTEFYQTGHPILLPGNPKDGSAVMVATDGAKKSHYSVNHGAGRMLGRKQAIRTLDQGTIEKEFVDADILTNCRQYPRDEAPAAYKSFTDVIDSVKQADLAKTVATLKARFVIKDSSQADD